MTIISESGLALSESYELGFSLDHPIVGSNNVVTIHSVSSTSSASNYPVSNLANPATHLKWEVGADSPASTYTYITVNFPSQSIDYLAIARHNLGTMGTPVAIGTIVDSPGTFSAIISDTTLTDDNPALFRLTSTARTTITLRINNTYLVNSPSDSIDAHLTDIAVLYVGKLLVLPRKLYQGLTPINYARTAKIVSGLSEAGQFLGRIVTQEFVKDTIPLSLIDPAYYRSYIDTFMAESKETPFFFAWRPLTYPAEIGYCHMTNDPMPANEAPHGLIAMNWEMTGIV